MKLIFCIDDSKGLFFIDKRQSADKKVVELIVNQAKENNATLWLSNYSRKLFNQTNYENISIIGENTVFSDNDIVFIEDLDINLYLEKANQIMLINWNRDYPETKKLTNDLSDFQLINEYTTKGNSHDELLIQEYIKGGYDEKK